MSNGFPPRQIYATATLSLRETEVLRLLGDGKTTNEIAAELKITVKTVQDFYQKLKEKATSGEHTSTESHCTVVA